MTDSYDEIPYEAVCVTDTHPDRLHVLGKLFGLSAPRPDNCRVLELGCADGSNLAPMAHYLPNSHFVGIDLSRVQVESGKALIRDAGLANIELRQADLTTLDASLGQFDYIIAHGLFSWVPRAIQDKILALCGELLTPHGVAYISYNVLPGWHGRSMLREMLLYRCRNARTPRARLEAAEQFLEEVGAIWAGLDAPAIAWLTQEVGQLREASGSYLFHEYLENTNTPILFTEFANRASQAGLRYLCETDVYSMIPTALGERAAHLLERIDDLIEQEQYNDFLRARPFRRTLLCRSEAALSRDIDLETFAQFEISASLRCRETPDLTSDRDQPYVGANGKPYTVTRAVTKQALRELDAIYPGTLSFAAVAQKLGIDSDAAATRARRHDLLLEFFSLYSLRGVHFTSRHEPAPSRVADRPRTHPLAQLQALRGHAATNRHTEIALDPLSATLLHHLDGTRTRDDLGNLLLETLARNPSSSEFSGLSSEAMRDRIVSNVDRLLSLFARHGLLIG